MYLFQNVHVFTCEACWKSFQRSSASVSQLQNKQMKKRIEGQFTRKRTSQPFHPVSFQSNMGAGEMQRTT